MVKASRQPLYRMKADFFKTLGHPARIRVLELLSEREHAVSELVPEIGIEPANLSQQLSILRRAGLVVARRDGLSVTYALTSPRVAELLVTARAILTGVVARGPTRARSGHGLGGLTGTPTTGSRLRIKCRRSTVRTQMDGTGASRCRLRRLPLRW